jgi:hypothetical protein
MDEPVVWLSAEDTLECTPEDIAFLWSRPDLWRPAEINHMEKRGTLGDRDVLIEVDLAPNSRRLKHWATWAKGVPGLLDVATPSARANWWLYLGTIQPNAITNFTIIPKPETNEGALKLADIIMNHYQREAA